MEPNKYDVEVIDEEKTCGFMTISGTCSFVAAHPASQLRIRKRVKDEWKVVVEPSQSAELSIEKIKSLLEKA